MATVQEVGKQRAVATDTTSSKITVVFATAEQDVAGKGASDECACDLRTCATAIAMEMTHCSSTCHLLVLFWLLMNRSGHL
jgi:hypothetical protein